MADASLPLAQHPELVLPPALPLEAASSKPQAIAPWWHTLCVLLVLAAWIGLSGSRRHAYDDSGHIPTYLSQMMLSWLLFGSVMAGIIDRRTFFLTTLSSRFRSARADAAVGVGVYAGIYGVVIAVALTASTGSMVYHARHAATPAQTSTSAQTSPVPPPPTANPDPLSQINELKNSRFHLNPKAVLALAPKTPIEMLLWILISITAGFSEEHIFRGYLLKQAMAWTHGTRLSPWLATSLSVLITALLFGSLHVYEGLGGALVVTFLGAVYAVVSLKLRNLRAVMVAHFLQDFVAGFMLFIFHAFYSRLLA